MHPLAVHWRDGERLHLRSDAPPHRRPPGKWSLIFGVRSLISVVCSLISLTCSLSSRSATPCIVRSPLTPSLISPSECTDSDARYGREEEGKGGVIEDWLFMLLWSKSNVFGVQSKVYEQEFGFDDFRLLRNWKKSNLPNEFPNSSTRRSGVAQIPCKLEQWNHINRWSSLEVKNHQSNRSTVISLPSSK